MVFTYHNATPLTKVPTNAMFPSLYLARYNCAKKETIDESEYILDIHIFNLS